MEPSGQIVIERGPDHRVWERLVTRQVNGEERAMTQRYVELESGLHYEENGEWKDSNAEIQPAPNGAVALHTRHKVLFSANLNNWDGAVDLLTRDNKRFRSRILGLAYWDPASGQTVLVAETKDSMGIIGEDKTQIHYPDAFTGILADVRYRNFKAGLEQDIILRERPPSPAEWGLNPATTRLQVLTEFFDPPVPQKQTRLHNGIPSDTVLDFGLMRMGAGKAFTIEQEQSGAPKRIPVDKQWLKLEVNRDFLIEELDYETAEPFLDALPLPAQAGIGTTTNAIRGTAGLKLKLPRRETAQRTLSDEVIQVASLPARKEGFVIDYAIMETASNFVFKADTTYYVTNLVTLSGVTTIEGGTVVKFGTNATGITIYDGVKCLTDAYRPATFTGKDDDSVGSQIPGLTGTNSGYYAGVALQCFQTNDISHIRVFNAGTGFEWNYSDASLRHAQFINCAYTAIYGFGSDSTFQNILIYNSDTAFGGYNGFVAHGEHITVHNCNTFGYDGDIGTTFYLTNSLLVNVTNWGFQFTVFSNFVAHVSGANIFQTVGAGSHYLAEASPYRNAGTATLSPGLLDELRQKTTRPPTVIDTANALTNNLTLSPMPGYGATDAPDLGYHYDRLDYAMGNARISGATFILTNGVAVGFYSPDPTFGACIPENGAILVSEGTPTNPNRLVWYNTVQEQASTNWAGGWGFWDTFAFDNYDADVTVNFRFTEFSRLADGWGHIGGGDAGWRAGLSFRDCFFYGGGVALNSAGGVSFAEFTGAAVNSLFHRSRLTCYATDQDFYVTLGNNLFYGGSAAIEDYDDGGAFSLTARNNLLDGVTLEQNATAPTHSHNAYWNCSTNLTPTGTVDQYLTNAIAYETGPLGAFHLPSGSSLIDAGSANADTLGLYHFTATANQARETNSLVDIGLHYVATANGLPVDTDGDGLPDYVEDVNGNGTKDAAETDVNDPDTDYDGRSDAEERLQGTNPLGPGSALPAQLALFQFNDAAFKGNRGQAPLAQSNVTNAYAWISHGLRMSNASPARLRYRDVEADGRANLQMRHGTVRFWFKPFWHSGAGKGPGSAARLVEAGTNAAPAEATGWWALHLNPDGTELIFASQTNGLSATNLTATVSFTSNVWVHIALAYTPTHFALYTNGVEAAGGTGTLRWPGRAIRAHGFGVGSQTNGTQQARGLFEDLETFNHAQSAAAILAHYEATRPPNHISSIRMWLKGDEGFVTNGLGNMQFWLDQIGYGHHASQLTEVNQPLYILDGLNNQAAVRFSGTNQHFTLPAAISNGLSQAEIFIVLKAASKNPPQNKKLWRFGSGGETRYPQTDGIVYDPFGRIEVNATGEPSQDITQAHIYNVSAKDGEWISRINGVTHFATKSSTFKLTHVPRLGNGDTATTSDSMFAGDIAEVLLYQQVLTESERDTVARYLCQRYDLVTHVPDVPMNPTAFAASSNQVTVAWDATLSNTNTFFQVQRKSGSGNFEDIVTLRNVASFLDSGLQSGTTYSYRVKAANYGSASSHYQAESAFSAVVQATTLADTAAIPLDALKLWLKADGGRGGSPVNFWADQSGVGNHAATEGDGDRRPLVLAGNFNGKPSVHFAGTNSFLIFTNMFAGWTEADAFVVLQAKVPTTSNQGLWLMAQGSTALVSFYPNTNLVVWENFARASTNGTMQTGVPPVSLFEPHVYNVFAKDNAWTNRYNHTVHWSTNGLPAKFSTRPRLGQATSGDYFNGWIAEVMFFNRELTPAERGTITTNYLRQRFNLW